MQNSPNCTVPAFNFGTGMCQKGANTVECNFSGGDCISEIVYPNCNLKKPPYVSNGYCRPDCGYVKSNSNCTHFVDVYPKCNATADNALSLIGNGICYYSEFNTAECGYEDKDCIEVTLECVVDNPSLIGNGVCNGGVNSTYNTEECGWDGGDCILSNALGYECGACVAEWLGDGICDIPHNNFECAWDGGDCVQYNEKLPTFYAKYPNCSVQWPIYLVDGECELDFLDFTLDIEDDYYSEEDLIEWTLAYNTSECGFDNGDCNNI